MTETQQIGRPQLPASSVGEVIEAAGGIIKLASDLGVSRQAIHQWVRVPAERALEVERITGISRYDLRPDVYGTSP